jgi:hypothetical protein
MSKIFVSCFLLPFFLILFTYYFSDIIEVPYSFLNFPKSYFEFFVSQFASPFQGESAIGVLLISSDGVMFA